MKTLWLAAFLLGVEKRALTICGVIGVILLVRLILRRAPRKITYGLWIFALCTLLLPVLPEHRNYRSFRSSHL